MRNVLCLVLLVPVFALAAGNLSSDAVVAPPPGPAGAHSTWTGGRPVPPPKATRLGTVDTVGGTIYDWVANGPTYRFCVNAPGYGLHMLWMYSNDTTGTQTDRNMRYQFYDYATHSYNWIDPDYMASGVNTFVERTGFGSLSYDVSNGAAVASAHGGAIRPIAARDIAAGAGIFEYCDGSPVLDGYLWPPIDVGMNQTIHMHCIDDASRGNLWYSRAATWCNWDPPAMVPAVPPTFPTQTIVASKHSDKVVLAWEGEGVTPMPGLYRVSNDGGTNWDPEVDFGYPPAYSADTGCSYWIQSVNPFLDAQDRLHIVVNTIPIINDTIFIFPNEIWHWCQDNSPEWSFIGRAFLDPHSSGPGTNATMACRPMLGADDDGHLVCTWEQFDSTNVDPTTLLFRADIWIAGSSDNGMTWTEPRYVNEHGEGSCRFPSISDLAIEGDPDTFAILYQIDSMAGFRAGSSPVGVWSFNPMVLQKIPADSIFIGIAETPGAAPTRFELSARPNPFGSRTVVSYAVPRTGDVSLVVYDAAGRPVKTLASGRRAAGRYAATWNADGIAAGVYFYTLTSGNTSVTKKLTLAH